MRDWSAGILARIERERSFSPARGEIFIDPNVSSNCPAPLGAQYMSLLTELEVEINRVVFYKYLLLTERSSHDILNDEYTFKTRLRHSNLPDS